MSGLGINERFSRAKNLEIILEHYRQNPQLTKQQVNYLSRFTWINHKKGLSYPLCNCLRCEGLNAISNANRQ
jgi:hypothetical protein